MTMFRTFACIAAAWLLLGASGAWAQSQADRDVTAARYRAVNDRLDPVSLALLDKEPSDLTREEARQAFQLGYEYFKKSDFLAAQLLFGHGLQAYSTFSATTGLVVRWPADEAMAVASYFFAGSQIGLCQKDRAFCVARLSEGDKPNPTAAIESSVATNYREALTSGLPAQYRADASKGCANALARLKEAVRKGPGSAQNSQKIYQDQIAQGCPP